MIAPLVSVDWLAAHRDDPRVRIVDTRWYLLEPQRGAAEYGSSHIPGAVYLDVATDLSGPPGSGPGRHPLPDADAFAATASRVGIGADVHVVAYDLPGGMAATRIYEALGIRDFRARGFAIGIAAHGIGTARAFQAEGPVLRIHAGLEDAGDLIADLEQGLERLRSAS